MIIKKTKKIATILFALLAMLFPAYVKAETTEKHYVTQVIPASFTDIVEFYGNTFLLDNGYIAFCLERDKGTPLPNTEVTLSYLDNPYIKKILYYGYNGPSRWEGFSSDGEAILCTSIMLSDAYSGYGYKNICDDFKNYIQNAPDVPSYSLSFTPNACVAYGNGNEQRTEIIHVNGDSRISTTFTLGSNMTLHFSDGSEKTGTVTVRGGDSFYISGPLNSDGNWTSGTLHLNENVYSAVIASTVSEDIQDLTYLVAQPRKECGSLSINWYNKGSLEIIKSSANNSVTNNHPDYSLENAQYGLYLSLDDAALDTNRIATLITDSTGYAKINDINKGTYYLKEVVAPSGYELSTEIITANVNTLATTTITTTDEPITKPFELMKYGETSSTDKPLQGAGFMVCPTSELTLDEEGNYQWDYNKTIPITSDGSHELFTGEDGHALSIPLPYGTYLIRETTIPPNYLPVSDFLITINKDTNSSENVIYLTDKSFKAYLQITKQDSTTDKIILDNPATFKIWSFTEEKYVTFEIQEGEQTLTLDQFQTDSDGTLITPEPLMPGKYLIEEVVSPTGYLPASSTSGYVIDIINTSDYTHYTDENGNYTDMGIFTVSIENTPITGQIIIHKSLELPASSEINDITSLSGIKFNIYAKEDILSPDGSQTIIYHADDLVETIITNEEGIAISSSILPLGIYEVEEENPPAGYIKAENSIIHLTEDNKSNTIINPSPSEYILCSDIYIENLAIEPEVLGETYVPETDIPTTELPETDAPKTGDTNSIFIIVFLILSFITGTISFNKLKK